MKMTTLNKGEVFIIEDYQKQVTSKDSFYMREKKNSFRIKPLTVAVSIVLTGLAFSSQVEAVGYTSPWIVGETNTYNVTEDVQINVNSNNEPAITIIYGTVNYANNNFFIYSNKKELPYSADNCITVYGQINGSNTANSNLFGAYNAHFNTNVTILTNNNTVIFKAGSRVKNLHVYGAKIDNHVEDGTNHAFANYNTVIIENGSDYTGVNKYVVGGYAIADNTVSASNNKIIIGAGKFDGGETSIIAGWTSTEADNQQATMCDNEVYLYGDADVSGADIYGSVRTEINNLSVKKNIPLYTVMTGNTLIFGYDNKSWEPANYTIKSVNNFSTIRMDTVAWGKTITINSLSNHSTDSTETKIDATNISFSGVDNIAPGDSYDLLTVSNITSGSVGLTSESSSFTLGSSLEGTAKVTQSGNTFSYTVNSLDPQPQTHTAAMTMSAGTVALTQGGDTL
jgi:hypothetical protein